MGESNGAWADVSEHDDELGQAWDSYEPLPDAGVNDALDAFCASKNITIAALSRLGTKLSDVRVLAFPYPGGIKYRNMETGQRWASAGAEWTKLKIVRAGAEPRDTVIVAEGETDAARLSMLYDADVAVLPAGAKRFTQGFADQLDPYKAVLVATDQDEAGREGLAKIQSMVPNSVPWPAPENADNDWCGAAIDDAPALPDPDKIASQVPESIVFGDLSEFEMPEKASWFDHEILPIGGSLVIHGWAKSFKSFLLMDMMAALAQGHDWAGFEPLEEPCKTCIIQWEIPAKYYRDRLRLLQRRAHDPELFKTNFGTWKPLQTPMFHAGDKAAETEILKALVAAGIQVVAFDPVRRALGGLDPNSEKDVRVLLGFFQRLQAAGITVVYAHHDNKAAAKAGGSDSTSMTGSGAWAGDADTLVHVGLPKGDKLETSLRRNLYFTTRNAPTPAAKGFEIVGNAKNTQILYSPVPHGDGFDDEPDEPAL